MPEGVYPGRLDAVELAEKPGQYWFDCKCADSLGRGRLMRRDSSGRDFVEVERVPVTIGILLSEAINRLGDEMAGRRIAEEDLKSERRSSYVLREEKKSLEKRIESLDYENDMLRWQMHDMIENQHNNCNEENKKMNKKDKKRAKAPKKPEFEIDKTEIKKPSDWCKLFSSACAYVVKKSIGKLNKADEFFAEMQKVHKPTFTEDGCICKKLRRLQRAANKAFETGVQDVKDAVRLSDDFKKSFAKRGELAAYYSQLCPVSNVIVFKDGYGRGEMSRYEKKGDGEPTMKDIADQSSHEDVFVYVLGEVGDEDSKIIQELEHAACYLTRDGNDIPMKLRVALVMQAFVRFFRPNYSWKFFIPAFIGSC